MKNTGNHGRESRGRMIEYPLSDTWMVMVGKSDEDNDRLSLHEARPDDWWFHVRGMPGSHVILRGPAGEEAPREYMKMAAAIAAYHSKARHGGIVAVSTTRARYVTKPRGAKPGTVMIRKETVLKARPAVGKRIIELSTE